MAGKDASKQFWKYHNEGILKKYKGQLQVGSLDSKKQEAAPPTPPATPPPQKDTVKPQAESGAVAPVPSKDAKEAKESMDAYGSLIPYADPSWYQTVRNASISITEHTTDIFHSTIHHTSMQLTRPFAPKFVNGLTLKSNPT